MSKKIGDLKWKTVALEGFPISNITEQFNGFVGLEECTDYDLDSKTQRSKKVKKATKRKLDIVEGPKQNKLKCVDGFAVESCNKVKPSKSNEATTKASKNVTGKGIATKVNKVKPCKIGETVCKVAVSNGKVDHQAMEAWSQFQIPDEILRAIFDKGFLTPTRIQELTLPAALLGRRDILGAAETGSGKTLAFGIPIIAGIMKMKENQLAGQDFYEAQYKKSSTKRNPKQDESLKPKKKTKRKKVGKFSKNNKTNGDESVKENGYESDQDDDQNNDDKSDCEDDDEKSQKIADAESKVSDEANATTDKENDSDNSDNYIFLSELLDSGMAPSSDDESKNSADEASNINDESGASDNEALSEPGNEQGIGCVKVLDDADLSGYVISKTGKPLYALILTPTRELAMQVSSHLAAAAKYTGIKVATVVGGMAQVKQERVLAGSPEIVVATPGRLWELLQQGEPHLQQIDNIKFLAIDETDRMVERNHFEELTPLLERLNSDEKRKSSRQNFVFSATLTMVHDLPAHMKGKKVTKRGKILNRKTEKMTPQQKTKRLIDMLGMTDPKIVDITTENQGTAGTLTECRITCSLEHKDYYLYYILKRHPGRTIVFCNSIGCVRRLAQLFTLLKCPALPLFAGLLQRQRLKNLESFRDNPNGALIATDVAARGLDIPDVDHVVHYQVPRTAENYVHRSGRTARANKEGLTILMMEPGEAFLYSKLCRTLNKKTELPSFPVPATVLQSMQETVQLARDVELMQLAQRKTSLENSWLDRAARDMDMLIDEDFIPMKRTSESSSKALQVKRKQLDALLARPFFPRGFSYKYPTLNEPNALAPKAEENALQVMKNAMQSGVLKREKRKSKNDPLLQLQKTFNKK